MAKGPQTRESHAHSSRSADVKRSRGWRDRCSTVSWCRSARISRCSDARDRSAKRREWSSETTTEVTLRGYSRRPVTAMDPTRPLFLIRTGSSGCMWVSTHPRWPMLRSNWGCSAWFWRRPRVALPGVPLVSNVQGGTSELGPEVSL